MVDVEGVVRCDDVNVARVGVEFRSAAVAAMEPLLLLEEGGG